MLGLVQQLVSEHADTRDFSSGSTRALQLESGKTLAFSQAAPVEPLRGEGQGLQGINNKDPINSRRTELQPQMQLGQTSR